MRPGDRKQRWKESHSISGGIMLIIGGAFILGAITNTGSSWGTFAITIWGSICIFCGILDFRDASRGWKMKDGYPPYWSTKQIERYNRFEKERQLRKRNDNHCGKNT